MYRKKNRQVQKENVTISLEELVPENHLLRIIDKSIDFNFIYDEVENLYSDKGRPGIDPVSLFKIVFIQYLFGIRSMRQTIKEIEVNVAYRWFIGYSLTEPVPHFSTFGKNYVRRFADSDIFERIFKKILEEAEKSGYVDASAIFIDSTHIKASANKHKSKKVTLTKPIKQYQSELEDEINEQRLSEGKKKFLFDTPEQVEKKISTTDPDSGLFVKGEHERCFAYSSQTACDKHGFVLDFELVAGNVHDSQSFHQLYEKLPLKDTKIVALDAGFKTPSVLRKIFLSGKLPAIPYTRPKTKDGFLRKSDYVYDEHFDCYICPQNQILKYTTTTREGYREFKSNPKICAACPHLERCTLSKNQTKVVTRHIWSKYLEEADHLRHTPEIRETYKKRKETIERVFADAKERHCLRYTHYRGLVKVKGYITLIFACMNLKKLAMKKFMTSLFSTIFLFLLNLKSFPTSIEKDFVYSLRLLYIQRSFFVS